MESISRRNKHIIELLKENKTVEEIAKSLGLKQTTVEVEIKFLKEKGLV